MLEICGLTKRFNGIPAVAAAWLKLRKSRREGWGEGRLLYADLTELVPDLGLRR